jgi:ribosomal protein S18 acetylase RimI-like enzyme
MNSLMIDALFEKFVSIASADSLPLSILEKSSNFVGFEIPKTDNAVQGLVEKSQNSARIQAKLLAEKFPHKISSEDALDVVAKLYFFGNWVAYQNFCSSFFDLSMEERLASHEAIKLTLPLWTLPYNFKDSDIRNDYLIVSAFILSKLLSITHEEGYELVSEISLEANPGSGLSKGEIINFAKLYHGHNAQYLLMQLLANPGLGMTTWSGLSSMTVREFLAAELWIEKEAQPMLAIDVLTANIQSSVHIFAERFLKCLYGPFQEKSYEEEKERILSLLATNATRNQAKKAGLDILDEVMDKSVIDAIRLVDSSNSCLLEPENYPASFYKGRFKKVLVDLKEVQPGYFLSIFRNKSEIETPAYGSIHEVLATIHTADSLVGWCSIDFVKNPDGSMSSLGQLLDEGGCTESCELAMSVCNDVILRGMIPPAPEHAAFVFDWEVAKAHRGQGLGRILLDAAFIEGSKGLGRPDVVFANLNPLSFPVPPFSDTRVQLSEFNQERKTICEIWNKCTRESSNFGTSPAEFFEGSYQNIYHMIGNCHIMGLGYFMQLDF